MVAHCPVWSQPLVTGAPARAAGRQVRHSGQQPGEPEASGGPTGVVQRESRALWVGAIRAVCSGTPCGSVRETWRRIKGLLHPGLNTEGKRHRESWLFVCLVGVVWSNHRAERNTAALIVSSLRLLCGVRSRSRLLLQQEGSGYLSGFRASSATHLTNYLWNCCIHSHLNKNLSTRRLRFVAAGPLVFPAHPEDDGLEVMQIHCHFICWCLPQRQEA